MSKTTIRRWKPNTAVVAAVLLGALVSAAHGQGSRSCPLDHFFFGQEDGKLFVDKQNIYRHGQSPDPAGPYPYNGYYSLTWSAIYGCWSVGEPGFSDTTDPTYGFPPEVELEGTPNQDYQIWFEILDLTPDFKLRTDDGTWLTQIGDRYNLSDWSEHHVHMKYRAYVAQSPAPDYPFYVTYRLVDELGPYESSEPFIVVFNVAAPAVEEMSPGYEVTLPSTCNAQLSFTFHREISVEGGPPVTITDEATHTHDYYMGYFDYEVSTDGLTLTLHQTGGSLPDDTWLEVAVTTHIRDTEDADQSAIPFVQYVHTMHGDVNGDGGVDVGDYALLYGCLAGPKVLQADPECRYADLDCDGDVDLEDFARLEQSLAD